MLNAFLHCNWQLAIRNWHFLDGVLAQLVERLNEINGRADILKESQRALTCSAIGKPRDSRYLNSRSNALKFFHGWIKRWIKTSNRVERLSFSSNYALAMANNDAFPASPDRARMRILHARTARKSGGRCLPRRSLIQGTTNPAPWLSCAVPGIWLIDENTQSGWRMIV
jgi:hypothetical protein